MRSTKTIKGVLAGVALVLIFTLARAAAAQTALTLAIGWPGDLTSDGTFLYLTTMDGSRPVIKIDPATGEVVDTIQQNPYVSGGPRGVAFDGTGHLFLTSMTPNVCELDMNGTRINCFSVPDPVPEVTTEGFRTGAIAFDGTNLYIGDTDAGTIVVTDRSGAFIRHFDSSRRPDGMVFDPSTSHLWLVDIFVVNKMSEMTTNGETVRECDIPYNPGSYGLGGIAIVGSKFYIAEPRDPVNPNMGTTIHVLEQSSLSCTPSLTAIDTTAPTTTAGGSPATNGAGWNNANVTVTLTATDDADGSGVESLFYASTLNGVTDERSVAGDTTSFLITADGTTTVTFHARDVAGNEEGDKTLVIRLDKTAPAVTVPANLTVEASSPAGAVTTFTPTAMDATSGVLSLASTPASGTTFPIGTTTVTVTASDTADNSSSASFTVTVLSPAQILSNLITSVASLNVRQGSNLLQNALRSVNTSNTSAACNQMSAFINQVRAQSGKNLTVAQASQLILSATNAKAALGCP